MTVNVTVSREAAEDLALTAAACALCFAEYRNDDQEAFSKFSELRAAIGSMELYARLTKLAAIACSVWDALDEGVRDTVTWDFEFLDHAVLLMVHGRAGLNDEWEGFADKLRAWAIAEAVRQEQRRAQRRAAE